ncbi:GntR family transcriptional regulator [Pseudomonas sp. RIT-PI-S]|uniref:FadR/GntR family transcriptional regulator n=1 Tax=Pseudomonas sp. RIT-PI-S TaxID=3035295 RepID=UPI0021D8A473|nr:GntR family transcriptional regulator [Pseudomonas sp. RIT-PI-S]
MPLGKKTAEKKPTAEWLPTRRLERGNAAEQILDELRDRILGGELARGSKLPTEKQLAEAYGVSGATVREAIRGLTTARLIEVRHGSGAYVTADTDQLIAVSMRSMIRLEQIGIPELLGVLGALNGYAAELAAEHATAEDIEFLERSLLRINSGADPEAVSQALTEFLDRVATASGNTLLAIFCRFLANIQISLARQLAGDSMKQWRATAKSLHGARQNMVDKIKARDAAGARAAAVAYHQTAQKIISALPNAQDALVSNNHLAKLMSVGQHL